MSLLSFLTGGGFKAVETVAKEWIDTKKETAEADALMIKTLDPNGLMRRGISEKVSTLYVFYVLIMVLMIFMEFMGWGDKAAAAAASEKLVSLFVPVTTMFTMIVSASFGVNYANTKQNK